MSPAITRRIPWRYRDLGRRHVIPWRADRGVTGSRPSEPG